MLNRMQNWQLNVWQGACVQERVTYLDTRRTNIYKGSGRESAYVSKIGVLTSKDVILIVVWLFLNNLQIDGVGNVKADFYMHLLQLSSILYPSPRHDAF